MCSIVQHSEHQKKDKGECFVIFLAISSSQIQRSGIQLRFSCNIPLSR